VRACNGWLPPVRPPAVAAVRRLATASSAEGRGVGAAYTLLATKASSWACKLGAGVLFGIGGSRLETGADASPCLFPL
jgi:hypothetical protein